MRLQKFRADFVADFRDVSFRFELGDFENKFAGERIAIRVQARGRQCEQRISWLYVFPGKQFLAFDGADDKSGKVVFPGRIKTRHLRRFTPDKRATSFAASAAHAVYKLFDDVRIHFAEREVIQKKERLGSLNQNVIHAMIHQVAADGGMNIHGHGDFELCADPIGTGNQNRFFEFFHVQCK
jgi:hypothetical protein